uniref:UBC core domain-containing protein n=1 Tax=Heterorhabditis bacteriophora TaxID=37862 RepID=A0A1I7X6F3_HETBA
MEMARDFAIVNSAAQKFNNSSSDGVPVGYKALIRVWNPMNTPCFHGGLAQYSIDDRYPKWL